MSADTFFFFEVDNPHWKNKEQQEEARTAFERLRSGSPEFEIEKTVTKTTYEYNGKKYDSLEDMPQEVQALLEDKDGNGIPDGFEN